MKLKRSILFILVFPLLSNAKEKSAEVELKPFSKTACEDTDNRPTEYTKKNKVILEKSWLKVVAQPGKNGAMTSDSIAFKDSKGKYFYFEHSDRIPRNYWLESLKCKEEKIILGSNGEDGESYTRTEIDLKTGSVKEINPYPESSE